MHNLIKYTNYNIKALLESSHEYFKMLNINDTMHTARVYNLAIDIAKSEGANLDIVAMGALLHDIGKINKKTGLDHTLAGVPIAEEILSKINIKDAEIKIVKECVLKHQIKDPASKSDILEVQIIQDADLIDELGAIGILKCTIYHAKQGDPIYFLDSFSRIVNEEPEMNGKSISIVDHFYDKLLVLDKKMNTSKGKEIALERIKTIEYFRNELKNESCF